MISSRPVGSRYATSLRRWPVTLLVAVLAVAACGSKPDLTDPREILEGAVAQLDAARSVRLELGVGGAIAIDPLGTGSGRPILLDGTTLTADLDLAGGRAKASFAVPALVGLTGEFLAPGGTAYLKTSLTGPLYLPLPAGDDPAPGASPGPQPLGFLRDLLADPAVVAAKLDDVDCAGTRCYQVRLDVDPESLDLGLPDLSGLSGLLGLPGFPLPSPGPDSATGIDGPIVIVVEVAKDSLRPATLRSDITAGDAATIELSLVLSAWDETVTVAAPPADQVGDLGDLFPFPLPSSP